MPTYNREILEELYRRKQEGRLSIEAQSRLKEIFYPTPKPSPYIPYAGPSQEEVIQIADVRRHHMPEPGWTEEEIIKHPTKYALHQTIKEVAKLPGTAIKEAGQIAVGLITLPAMAWWEMMSIADRNIQPTQEDINRIAQQNKVSPQTVIEGFESYRKEKKAIAPDYSGATKEIFKDWIKPYTSLDNFIKEAPKRPVQIVLDATIVAGLITKFVHTGAKLPRVVKALRDKGITNEEIKVGLKFSADNLKVKKELRESTIGAEPIDIEKPILGRETGIIRVVKEPKKEKVFEFSENIEKRYEAAKEIKKENILTRINQTLSSIKNKITRDVYEHLPRTAEFMPLRSELLQLRKVKGIASHKAVRTVQQITKDLDRPSFDLFTRKVIMEDLLKVSEKGQELPFGFTAESLLQESTRLDSLLKQYPKVTEAIKQRTQIWNNLREEYSSAMKKIGFNVEDKLKNEAYFRHQVLEYINAQGLFGTGRRLKTPTARGFLRKRKGSTLDISTNYLQVESEVVAQMLHDIRVAKTLKNIENKYSIHKMIKASYLNRLEALLPKVEYNKEQLIFGMQQNNIPMVAYENTLKKKLRELGGEDFLRKHGLEDWRQVVKREYPDYDLWQPREGNVFFMSDSVPAKLAEELSTGALEQVGITAKDLQKMLSVGGRRKELVLKNEIIDTLNNLSIQPSQNIISQASKKLLRGWKIWTLISPRRYAKYFIRNLSGDADALFVGNPSAFKEIPTAIQDLWAHYAKKETMSSELKMWFNRGGFESTLQAQEMGEINNLKIFLDLQKPTGELKDVPLKVWQTYWKKARLSTDFREAILRYAAFRDYLRQMRQTGGVPKNFGASIPDEIMSLSDPADKAFHLSNELLGAYDRVSVTGHALRDHLIPFWSWKEVNFKRYIRLFKNAANDKKLCEALGRKAVGGLAKTPYRAYRVGKFLIRATAFWSALEVYNNTRFPEEEKLLPQDIRNRPHIILGRDENGKVQYFSRIGALGDFLESFGLDVAPQYVRKWLDGKTTLKETAQEIAKESIKAPVNVLAQGVTPFAKLPAEVISRQTFFPDVFEPGIIRDRGFHLARGLGLENEYKAIMNLPSEGYGKSLPDIFVYRLDPLQGAYSDIYNEKQRFLKKIGKFGEGFWLTPRGNALYNFKLALRYDDRESAQKSLLSYFQLGGTEQGLEQSLNNMNPLSGLNEIEQALFVTTLNDENRKKLAMAFKFWTDTLLK